MVTSPRTREPANPDRRRAMRLGSAVSFAGAIVFVLSAATMVFLWVRLLHQAMHWTGFVLGLVTAPVAAAYPFLHWLAKGELPGVAFAVWFAGVVGLAATMTWTSWGRYRVLDGYAGRRSPLTRVATDEAD